VKPREPRRILLIHFGQLGDAVLALPAARALQAHFAQSELTVLAARGPHAVFEMAGFRRVLPVDRAAWKRWPVGALGGVPMLLARLRMAGFDLSVDLHSYKETNWLAFLAGIPQRVAMLRPTRSVARLINLAPPPDDPYGRLIDRYCRVLEPLGIEVTDRVPRLEPIGSAGFQTAEPVLGLCPGAGHPGRRWPADRFAALARQAINEWRAQVVVFAGPEEDATLLAPFQAVPQAQIVRGLSLAQLTAALAACRLVISNPTGPSHLAAAVGTTLLTLGEIPAFDPVPQRPGQVTALRARGTVAALTLEEVADAAAALWNR